MSVRNESDLLGQLEVPSEALYGAQTCRAIENFPLGKCRTIGSYPALINSILLIKKVAALTNRKIGALPEDKARAIIGAADRLIRTPRPEQFPVHALHGGGGTSANMNANEVLANLGEEMLGGHRGEYRLLHPNDHVNLNQSTNDVYPTACHMAVLIQWPHLDKSLGRLIEALTAKSLDGKNIPHIARTCFQDAVDITFFNLFQGYVGFVTRARERSAAAVERLHTVNLGGTIVGRAEDVPEPYMREIIPAFRIVTGDERYRQAENLFDAAQNADDLVAVSAQLDLLARGLIKIAQDLRVLGSGPEAGLREIKLPGVQPGSSIMPGKVNPVIPEFVIQLCFQVIGKHAACAAGLDHGELDLNVWESSMLFNILDSMELLESGVDAFADRCIQGLEIPLAVNVRKADSLIPLLTRMTRQYGYSKVTAICKEAGGDADKIRALLAERLAQA